MAKARPTMKATFTFSNATPSTMATTPRQTVAILETRTSDFSSVRPAAERIGVEIMADRAGARESETGHHGQDGRERHRGDEAEQRIPAHRTRQMDRGMLPPPFSAAAAVKPVAAGLAAYSGLTPTSTIAPKPMMKVRI